MILISVFPHAVAQEKACFYCKIYGNNNNS